MRRDPCAIITRGDGQARAAVVAKLFVQSHAEIVVRQRMIGFEAERFPKFFHGLGNFSVVAQKIAIGMLMSFSQSGRFMISAAWAR